MRMLVDSMTNVAAQDCSHFYTVTSNIYLACIVVFEYLVCFLVISLVEVFLQESTSVVAGWIVAYAVATGSCVSAVLAQPLVM